MLDLPYASSLIASYGKKFGKDVDWSKVDKEDHLLAMERSSIRNIEIKYILQEALTDEVDSWAQDM